MCGRTAIYGGEMRLRLVTGMGALYQGDCLDLLTQVRDATVDCVFADPPFNLGKSYGSRRVRDRLPEDEYLEWTMRWLTECIRVLKPGGSLFVYHVPRWLIPIGTFLQSVQKMEFRHWIAIKMKNHFPVKGRLHPAHYGLLYFTKAGSRHRFRVVRTPSPVCPHCGELLRDYGGYGKKYQTDASDRPMIQLADVWDDVGPRIREKTRPRAMNELTPEIPRRLIEISTREGDLVLDLFVGGGSVVAVAEKLKRHWLGTELGPTVDARRELLTSGDASPRKRVPRKVRDVLRKRVDGRGAAR